MIASRAAIVLAALSLGGCNNADLAGDDLERMLDQPKALPFESSRFFEDGRAMRDPPAGAVPRDRITSDPALTEGLVAGAYVERIPLRLTLPMLEHGRARFEATCGACHGLRGDGESRVALTMELRRPPSLVDEKARSLPPGRIYQVVNLGYGLMRQYGTELTVEERWEVVGYLRALQRSLAVPLAALPPAARQAAEETLR